MNSWIERTDSAFKDMNLTTLGIDECFLNITSHIKNKIWLYALSEDCVTCPFKKLAAISPHQDNILKVDTTRNVQWKFFRSNLGQYAKNDEKEFCSLAPSLGEFGIYDVIVEKNGSCDYSVVKDPVNIYLPILVVLLILLALTALIKITNKFFKRHQRNAEISTREDTELNEDKPLVKPRLRSLDTFRGLTIVLMIFVNSGGGHYWWIEHATWNGLHIADLVFPWFLWIMGVCIPMSVKSQLGRNIPKRDMLINVLRRSVTLFLIGLFLNTANGPKLEEIRIFGVLQRFGIAYFFVTSLHIICMKPINLLPQNNRKRQVYDIIILLPQWGVMLLVIAVHLAITFSLPVPGCPTGYLGPGGNHEMGQHKNCIGGATGFIDRTILGAKHIYQWPTAKHVYASMAFDPEGVFGCLLTIVQVFFGVQCGMILTIHSKWKARITRWIIWAFCCGLIAGILCNFSKEDGWIPVNKNMWSLSYALVTSSFAFTLLSICYYFIDVKKWWDGSPFVYAGMNAIVMYIGHTVFHKMMPWHFRIGEMNTHFILLFESTWNTVLWVGIAYWLYCKEIFYSI